MCPAPAASPAAPVSPANFQDTHNTRICLYTPQHRGMVSRLAYQRHLSLKDVVAERWRGQPSLLTAHVAVYMQACLPVTVKLPLCQHLIPIATTLSSVQNCKTDHCHRSTERVENSHGEDFVYLMRRVYQPETCAQLYVLPMDSRSCPVRSL